jgi:hypothetical protein
MDPSVANTAQRNAGTSIGTWAHDDPFLRPFENCSTFPRLQIGVVYPCVVEAARRFFIRRLSLWPQRHYPPHPPQHALPFDEPCLQLRCRDDRRPLPGFLHQQIELSAASCSFGRGRGHPSARTTSTGARTNLRTLPATLSGFLRCQRSPDGGLLDPSPEAWILRLLPAILRQNHPRARAAARRKSPRRESGLAHHSTNHAHGSYSTWLETS